MREAFVLALHGCRIESGMTTSSASSRHCGLDPQSMLRRHDQPTKLKALIEYVRLRHSREPT